MLTNILSGLVQFFELTVFFYCFGILTSYVIIGMISAFEVMKYRKKRDVIHYDTLVNSPYLPSISVVAPAYNESQTIVDNIRSLLSIHYGNLSIIIVNDGSKDDTLDRAIKAYDLYQVDFDYTSTIDTKQVRGIYKSRKKSFNKLIVVDKENGGKADAINVGINVSSTDYFACIDVDCIIEQDAFLKMAEPIMRVREEKIVAVGGIVGLTNDSIIKEGKIVKICTPNSFVPKIQVLEYFRAFLLGRTAWAKYNGLLLISGAFGVFDRKIVLEVGGYDHNTVGEDMELVMRIHKYCRERKMKYRIAYIPESLCWTEAPADNNILGRQRHRWTRGTIECLTFHKTMFLNPKYGILGMISYPYWLLAEWMAPFAEAGGLLFFLIIAMLGLANWPFFWSLLALVYFFSVSISFFAVFIQEISYANYTSCRDIIRLMKAALIEPIRHHPRTVFWSIKGNFDWFSGKSVGWGEMTRAGFTKK